MTTKDENLLRVVRFETPEYIPRGFFVNDACWHHYPQGALQELMASHPLLFPGFEKTSEPFVPEYSLESRVGEPYTDPWGCIWQTTDDGICGSVIGHPLESWDNFEGYVVPDPNTTSGRRPRNWAEVAEGLCRGKRKGGLASGSLEHGHTFLRLADIRGYENLILDMADEEPRLYELIQMVEDFNLAIVRRYVALGIEWMGYPEDLGMQVGPMLSPQQFHKYIKPTYQRLMAPARKAGVIVHMHSDGDIRQLVDDLLDGGVQVVNLQDLVNGIDWIKENLTGKYCVDLDIDRQEITRFGTPAQIDALIRREVEELSCKEGGLMMVYGFYPGTPIENANAVADAMERYATYYS